MKARSSAAGLCSLPGFETSVMVSTRKLRALSSANSPSSPTCEASVCRRSRFLASVYSSGLPSFRATRSNLWRCSSLMPTASGTGVMPPHTAAQKASRNCSLLLRKMIT